METYDSNKSTTEVRQGSRRTANLRVLIISLLAVIVLFGIVWAFFGMAPQTPPAP